MVGQIRADLVPCSVLCSVDAWRGIMEPCGTRMGKCAHFFPLFHASRCASVNTSAVSFVGPVCLKMKK
jgi:hypothetical protein